LFRFAVERALCRPACETDPPIAETRTSPIMKIALHSIIVIPAQAGIQRLGKRF
jgi:hypothetical protein